MPKTGLVAQAHLTFHATMHKQQAEYGA